MRVGDIYCFIFLLLILFNQKALAASFGTPPITNFPRITYQAGTQNWVVKQDKRGIVYFGNNKGLLSFDGTNWKVESLPNNTIVRSLSIDDNDRLYVGGQNELGYIEINKQGEDQFVSLKPLIPEAYSSFEDIWQIFTRPEGVFFCSEKAIFQLHKEKIQVITSAQGRFENFFLCNDQLIVQEPEIGLLILQGKQLIPLAKIKGQLLPQERIVSILPFQGQQSLIITFSKGLYLLDKGNIQAWNTAASSFLEEHQAFCATQLQNGNYAVGTPQNGLLIFDQSGQLITHLNKNSGLQNNTILSLTQDIHQNLWLGLDNGIDYVEINSPFSVIQMNEEITGTGYTSIIHDDKLYLGTNQGLFYTPWNEEQSAINKFQFLPVANSRGQVWNISKLGNRIIIGQHKGAGYLDGDRIIPFSSIQGAWKFTQLESNPDFALEGTYNGLYLYKKKKEAATELDQWELVDKIKGFDESTRVFEVGKNGRVWVSHAYKGLYKLQLSSDLLNIEKVELYNDTLKGLPGGLLINAVSIRNEIIFTTQKGIYQYDPGSDRFVEHTDFKDIFGADKNVHRMIEDELGNIWFSVDKEFGVIKVEEKGIFNEYKIYYYNQLQEDLVDGFEHIYAYNDDHIFIGTEKGFVHYSHQPDRRTTFPLQTLIRNVTLITSGDSTIYGGNKAVDAIDQQYHFHHTNNDFRFSFSAPYYEKISYLTYQYKLIGFNETWTDWLPKTEKEFTNLAPGDYEFVVQAKNAYGQISEPAFFSFTIDPPWYGSIYAKIIYFILSVLALISLVKYVSKREAKKTEAFKIEQSQKLEKKEAEFKKEVEKSENEIIKLRNEKLHTDINHKNSQLASTTMHLVQKSEILIKIKNDLKKLEPEVPAGIRKRVKQITNTIESDIQLDDTWEQFESYFDQVHENFFKRLRQKFPDLTPKDQKLCAYLRMNLTTKEIAPLLNISVRGVEISRYRLRKKLMLDSEVNLVTFIMEV